MGGCCGVPQDNRVVPDGSPATSDRQLVTSAPAEENEPQHGLFQPKNNKVAPASEAGPKSDGSEQLPAGSLPNPADQDRISGIHPPSTCVSDVIAQQSTPPSQLSCSAVTQHPTVAVSWYHELQSLVNSFMTQEASLRENTSEQILALLTTAKTKLPEEPGELGRAMCSTADCVNQILAPVVQHADTAVAKQAGNKLSWATLTPAELLQLLIKAHRLVWDKDKDISIGITTQLLDLLYALKQHQVARWKRIAASTTVGAINRILSMFAAVFFRKVVVVSQAELEQQRATLASLQRYMCWTNNQLAVALDPASKATMVYLDQAVQRGEKRLEVTVRRNKAFWEAASQAHHKVIVQGSAPLQCFKLFPSFVDENIMSGTRGGLGRGGPTVEAGEGHGPRKEFFGLVGTALTGPTGDDQTTTASTSPRGGPALLTFNRSAGTCWFNSRLMSSPDVQHQLWFVGWLAGQCIFNRSAMGMPLAPLIFRRILNPGWQPTMAELESFDPAAAQSLKKTAALPSADFAAVLGLEDLPADTSKDAYIAQAVRGLLVDSVAWQYEAFKAGFVRAVDMQVLQHWQVSDTDLSTMVHGSREGGAEYDVLQTFRLVVDGDLQEASGNPMGPALIRLLQSWPLDRRRQFVKFVTGTDRLPLPGTEVLHVVAPFVAIGASEHQRMLGMLPQAHTCDNTLELPNYWESLLARRKLTWSHSVSADEREELQLEVGRMLEERLAMAITMYDGYGLDEKGDGSSD